MMRLRFFRQVLGTLLLVHDHDGKRRVEVASERSIHAKRAYCCLLLPPIALVGSRSGYVFFVRSAIGSLAFAPLTLAC